MTLPPGPPTIRSRERVTFSGRLLILARCILLSALLIFLGHDTMRTTDLDKILGKLLQHRRKDLNWSQTKLAEKTGFHRTYISLLERGERSPTAATLFRVCRRLRLRPSELWKEIEEEIVWINQIG